jgi:hypothetical protein
MSDRTRLLTEMEVSKARLHNGGAESSICAVNVADRSCSVAGGATGSTGTGSLPEQFGP